MNKTISLMILLLSFILVTSCDKEINNWEIDASHDRLFQPLTFEEGSILATSIQITHTKVMNSTDYVFEFSEDSLLFNNMVRVDTILGDTLTPYKEESASKVEYRTWFTNLKGVTAYSVRMKAISRTTGRESKYVELYFKTPEEQIFKQAVPEIDKVTLTWIPVASLTHFILSERNEKGELINPKELPISKEVLTAQELIITGLTGGTGYTVQAFDNETKRGTSQFRTLGIQNGEIAYVTAENTVSQILEDCAARKVTDVSLMFTADEVYVPSAITIPGGIENLAFVGKASDTGELPILELPSISMGDPVTSITFQNLVLDGMKSDYLFSIGNANCFKSVNFTGCKISNYNRSVVRLNVEGLEIGSIAFSNCIIDHIANNGYGFIYIGKVQKRIGVISITNSTLTEMGTLIEQRGAVAAERIHINQCIVYNQTFASGNYFRLEAQPIETIVTNTIFAGSNNNSPINSGYKDYKAFLSFNSCYITSDLKVNKYGFADITPYDGASEALFIDPVNGNFRLRLGAQFSGEGKTGDPRWW